MSGCEMYQEMISRLLDGELEAAEEAAEEAALTEHLKICPSCAALYAAFSGLSGALSQDLEEPPEEIRENVMAQIRRNELAKKNRWARPVKNLLAAAACLAVIVGLVYGAAPLLRAKPGAAADTAQSEESAEAVPEEAPAAAAYQEVPAEAPTAEVPVNAEEEAGAGVQAIIRMAPMPETAFFSAADSGMAPLPKPTSEPSEGMADNASEKAAEGNVSYIELWDAQRQERFLTLLMGEAVPASENEVDMPEPVELADCLAYVCSLNPEGDRQISVYLRDGVLYYIDSWDGAVHSTSCTAADLEEFFA